MMFDLASLKATCQSELEALQRQLGDKYAGLPLTPGTLRQAAPRVMGEDDAALMKALADVYAEYGPEAVQAAQLRADVYCISRRWERLYG